MRFIYVTDLHGWGQGYTAVLRAAVREKAEFIVNGGDMLPKGDGILRAQKQFIQHWCPMWLRDCQRDGLKVYAMFGNDDLVARLHFWRDLLGKTENLFDISTAPFDLADGIKIIGFNWVPDYPFGLKDWCLLDSRGWQRPEQLGDPCISRDHAGFVDVTDIDKFFAERPTIDEALERQPATDWAKTIFVCHCPPFGMELGRCSRLEDVGSKAVRRWIERTQPLLCLHGHIHEGPSVSGLFTGMARESLCVQPGQERPQAVAMVLVDIVDAGKRQIEVKRMLEDPSPR